MRARPSLRKTPHRGVLRIRESARFLIEHSQEEHETPGAARWSSVSRRRDQPTPRT